MKNLLAKIGEKFKPFFDPAPKDTSETHADERVREAAKYLPKNIKEMSKDNLARAINKLQTPNKWAITRACAQPGQLQKQSRKFGNDYDKGYTSDKRRQRRLRQIEKGLIKLTEETIKEEVNEGNS